MTHIEWHSEFDVFLRRLNSSRKGNIAPEVKDIIINRAILNVIDARLSNNRNPAQEGLKDTEKRLDDLRDFMKPLKLDTYVNADNPLEESFAVLPYDYYHLVRDSSMINYNCNGVDLTNEVHTKSYYGFIPFPDDSSTSPLYVNLTLNINGVIEFQVTDYDVPDRYKKDSKFILINAILATVNRNHPTNDIEIYWENYGDVYQANSFVVIYNNAYAYPLSPRSITYGGNIYLGAAAVSLGYKRYSNVGTLNLRKENRLTSNESLRKVLSHYYSETDHNSPVSSIIGNKLRVYNDATFKVCNIVIEYISYPVFLNTNLNYAPVVTNRGLVNEILERAVNIANADMASPDYQFSVADGKETIK